MAAGGSAGAAVATAEDTAVRVSVSPADAMESLPDSVELVCRPPELCTTPERGSAVEASLGEEVEPVWASTGLCTLPGVEPRRSQPLRPTNSFSTSDPLMTDLLRILMPNPNPNRTDDDELRGIRRRTRRIRRTGGGRLGERHPRRVRHSGSYAEHERQHTRADNVLRFTGIALRAQPARAPAERPPEPA